MLKPEVSEVLSEITAKEAASYYGDELLNYLNTTPYMDEIESPMDCLVLFKNMVSPRSYSDSNDLKKMVCDYIDLNMTHAMY